MAIRPVDLQNIINASVEVAKVSQTRNDTFNMHQGQFAIQLQKDAEKKQEQVQKGEGTKEESTKIKDEEKQRERRNFGKKEKKEKKKELTKKHIVNLEKDKKDYHHIDIKV